MKIKEIKNDQTRVLSLLPLLAALRYRNSDIMRFTTLVSVGIITTSHK